MKTFTGCRSANESTVDNNKQRTGNNLFAQRMSVVISFMGK